MAGKLKPYLRKGIKWSAYGLLLLLFLLVVLEVMYRYQVIDTYMGELDYLNPAMQDAPNGRTVLVMGDSFSALPGSYVEHLRSAFPHDCIINSAIPGTGVLQANYMASRRFTAFKPDVFLYQIYVGNDLLNLRYPINMNEVGLLRNLYWITVNRIRSLAWLNYAVGKLCSTSKDSGLENSKPSADGFSPKRYSQLEKLYFKAEPFVLENQALLLGGREKDFDAYLCYLDQLLEHCKKVNCKIVILVVPHCAQVDRRYMRHMQALGARFARPKAMLNQSYPFFARLQQQLGSRCNLVLVNALPRLRAEAASGTAVYYANDPHLSPDGQQVLANLVIDILGNANGRVE